MPENILPAFHGSSEQALKRAIAWAEKSINFSAIRLSEMPKLGSRTVRQILSGAKVSGFFGCLDKAAVIGTALKENGFEVSLVTERMKSGKGPNGLHFSLKAEKDGEKFTVDSLPHETRLIKGWREKDYSFEARLPMGIKAKVESRQVLEKPIPAKAIDTGVFRLAGIRGNAHFAWLSRTNPLKFAKFFAKKSRKSRESTMAKWRKRSSMRK